MNNKRLQIIHDVLRLLEGIGNKELILENLRLEAKFYHERLVRVKTKKNLYESLMVYIKGGKSYKEIVSELYTKLGDYVRKEK